MEGENKLEHLGKIAIVENDVELEKKLDRLEGIILEAIEEMKQDMKAQFRKELEEELPDLSPEDLEAAVENELNLFVNEVKLRERDIK